MELESFKDVIIKLKSISLEISANKKCRLKITETVQGDHSLSKNGQENIQVLEKIEFEALNLAILRCENELERINRVISDAIESIKERNE